MNSAVTVALRKQKNSTIQQSESKKRVEKKREKHESLLYNFGEKQVDNQDVQTRPMAKSVVWFFACWYNAFVDCQSSSTSHPKPFQMQSMRTPYHNSQHKPPVDQGSISDSTYC
eukprot:TRINITY_DN2051_c1_g1_i1.p1 TRINITY_DN2051_c1_g1~~TRINITY_DN2051_c1_g1_i1.p1  ORF type:complete len:114 (-),score=8.76 TRINITY_DN2051_c1_g1_i1:1007-1348(-)